MSVASIVSDVQSITAPAFVSSYDMAFQVSPIILVGGIAASAVGGQLPILALMGQSSSISGIASLLGGLDDFLARYLVLPGGTLINNAIGNYPFANQQVAANAIIQQPLNISLEMICPVKDAGGYLAKMAVLTSLQNALQQHNNAAGTYNIATPAFIYTNCLMTSMTDITSGGTNQKQVAFQLDFQQPLITQQQATAAYSSLMGKVASGAQVTTNQWSGASATVGTAAQNATTSLSNVIGSVSTFPGSPQ